MSARHLSLLMKAIVRDGWHFTETLEQAVVLQYLTYHQNEAYSDLAWPSKRKIAAHLTGLRSKPISNRTVQRILSELTDDLRIVTRYDVTHKGELDQVRYETVRGKRKEIRTATGFTVRAWGWTQGGTHRFLTPVRSTEVAQRDAKGRPVFEYHIELPQDSRVSPPTPTNAAGEATPRDTASTPGVNDDRPARTNATPAGADSVSPPETDLSTNLCIEASDQLSYVNGKENAASARVNAHAAPLISTTAFEKNEDAGTSPRRVDFDRSHAMARIEDILFRLLDHHGLSDGTYAEFLRCAKGECRRDAKLRDNPHWNSDDVERVLDAIIANHTAERAESGRMVAFDGEPT